MPGQCCFHSLQENLKLCGIKQEEIDRERFHSLQENLKRYRKPHYFLIHLVFPFLTGKFEAIGRYAVPRCLVMFPFLTGKFEAP